MNEPSDWRVEKNFWQTPSKSEMPFSISELPHNISHQTQTHERSPIKWQMNEFCANLYLWYSQGLPKQFLQQWFYWNNYAVSAIVFIMFERNWIELFGSSIIHKIFKSFSRFGATHSGYQRSSPNDALCLAFSFI